MAEEVSRREFLNRLGVSVTSAAALGASAGFVPSLSEVRAAEPPKGRIPEKPYKVGHMTFFTGAAAVLGEPSYKGHVLAAEEINAQGQNPILLTGHAGRVTMRLWTAQRLYYSLGDPALHLNLWVVEHQILARRSC